MNQHFNYINLCATYIHFYIKERYVLIVFLLLITELFYNDIILYVLFIFT